MPSANHRHHITTPRGYTTSTTASGVPTTTRTYAVNQDPRNMSKTRDGSRTRRSTLDSVSRPPVIITTTQKDRPSASSGRSGSSPIRDDYRASDGQVFSQPASSMRSRSAARPYHAPSTSVDRGRYRSRDRSDSLLSARDAEAYRSSRPSVVYPSDPRHSTAAIDYGDDYQYTKPGELAKYDLDHDQLKHARPRRHDSVDKGYYRPNLNYNADQRGHDISYGSYNASSRLPEGRGGPPPSTRGFDKINRTYEGRDVPPSAPVPPSPTKTSSQLEVPGASSDRRDGGRRPRPLSLHQDIGPRSSHHEDYHRSREDERAMRDLRDRGPDWDREYDRRFDSPRFYDESVASRGFGIRTDLLEGPKERDRRPEPRIEEPRKRSDEELTRSSDRERDDRRRAHPDVIDDRRDRRADKQDRDDGNGSRIPETLASGLGAVASAAAATTRVAPSREEDKKEQSPSASRSRYSPPSDRDSRYESEPSNPNMKSFREREQMRGKEPLALPERDAAREREPIPEREAVRERDLVYGKEPVREADAAKERDRDAGRDIQTYDMDNSRQRRDGGDVATVSGSESDEKKRVARRNRPSNAFNPNDASDLKQLKQQLAAMDVSDERKGREPNRTPPEEKTRSRSPSEERTSAAASAVSSREHSRSRELIVPPPEGRHVRLVSPPKETSDDKPLRGILKQPRTKFPEEQNPVREGVAPHKEDKKLKDAPAGARWTKINRKIVNPEALTVGKERFEVRDDFVIVLRVLGKEEIQAYAAATQVLRGKLIAHAP